MHTSQEYLIKLPIGDQEEGAQIKYSPCETSSNSAQNGRDSCTSTLQTLKRPLIASIERVYGEFSEHMEYRRRLFFSSKASTATSHAG